MSCVVHFALSEPSQLLTVILLCDQKNNSDFTEPATLIVYQIKMVETIAIGKKYSCNLAI